MSELDYDNLRKRICDALSITPSSSWDDVESELAAVKEYSLGTGVKALSVRVARVIEAEAVRLDVAVEDVILAP